MKTAVDVVIVGGGPAGLNAALVLGRARWNVVVIDEELPRNRVTHESHGFLTRDGISPSEFRQIAKAQISAYPSVQFVTDIAVQVNGGDGCFTTVTKNGDMFDSRKILFATGMKDVLPDVPGLKEVYGTSAFVCPFCDGWELQDRHLVVLGEKAQVLHLAKVLRSWTDRLTVCTNGVTVLSEEQKSELKERRIQVFEEEVVSIESDKGIVRNLRLQSTVIDCDGIFFVPTLVQGTSLPHSLGCEVTEYGAIRVGLNGKTNVPGVYVAGDAARGIHQLIAAASEGAMSALGITSELVEEDWHR